MVVMIIISLLVDRLRTSSEKILRAHRPEAAPQVKIQTVYSEAISCGD